MKTKTMVQIALFLNILMALAAYVFAYSFSIFALGAGPFWWICNAAGFAIAYQGLGTVKKYAMVALRNNEGEMAALVSTLRFTSEEGKTIADPFKNFHSYIVWSLVAIVLLGGFGILVYSMVSESLEFQEAEKNLNALFVIFTIIGAIIGLSPIKDRIDYFFLKHGSEKLKTVDQFVKEEQLRQKLGKESPLQKRMRSE